MSSEIRMIKTHHSRNTEIERLKEALEACETIVIGAGAGLSTSAGFIYTGERFKRYFYDFIEKYSFEDMYTGGFYPFKTKEEFWAYWSRYIYINRYMDPPKPVYKKLYDLIVNKDYFVITTNVDHCFQKAGFDRKRLFYTQGDYGLFQCSSPCHSRTYDNETTIRDMLKAQGFTISKDKELLMPKEGLKMKVPSSLIPKCPVCGEDMTMNLRSDARFVEDEGWHDAASRYSQFLIANKDRKVLYLELGVGFNTPAIIKIPFINQTQKNSKAIYACLNYNEAYTILEILDQSICIDGDIGEILEKLE